MTTEVAKIDLITPEDLGQPSDMFRVLLPRMGINRSPDDDDGNEVPMGTYFFMLPNEDNKVFYAKTIKFRPFINTYRYEEWGPKENKWVNRTIYIKNLFNEDALDEKGGSKCGKVHRSKLDDLPDGEKARQSNIKCKRYVFGLVSAAGVLQTGDEHTVENLPVVWKSGGINFIPVDEALKSLSKQKKRMIEYNFNLSTKRQKRGSNIFYEAILELDNTPISIGEKELETLKVFSKIINRENEEVHDSWREANNIGIPFEFEEAKKPELVEEMGDSIEDILP